MLVAARAVHFASTMVLFGMAAFPFYSGAPSPRAAGVAGNVVRAAALLAIMSGLVWAAASYAAAVAGFGDVLDRETVMAFLFETRFGQVWLLRLGLLAALAVCGFVTSETSRPDPATASLALVAALLLVSQSWLGHAAGSTGAQAWLAMAAYGAHVLGAGAWLGGLVPLGFVLVDRANYDARVVTRVVARFSTIGTVAIAFVLAGGIVSLSLRWDGREPLTGPDWGRVLFGKLALFAILLILAATNRFVLAPALSRGPHARARMARLVGLEQGVGVLALVAAAWLGVLAPPAGPLAAP